MVGSVEKNENGWMIDGSQKTFSSFLSCPIGSICCMERERNREIETERRPSR